MIYLAFFRHVFGSPDLKLAIGLGLGWFESVRAQTEPWQLGQRVIWHASDCPQCRRVDGGGKTQRSGDDEAEERRRRRKKDTAPLKNRKNPHLSGGEISILLAQVSLLEGLLHASALASFTLPVLLVCKAVD